MRRGEKAPPVYRASRVGMARTIPFKRPDQDSLPVEAYKTPGCGDASARWAIVAELRS